VVALAPTPAVVARVSRRRTKRANPSRQFLSSYAATLDDPFECGPVPLGYDCFLPTALGSAYQRGSFLTNADGSFSTVLFPDFVNMVQSSNGAHGALHAGAFSSATNLASIQANFSEVRIVSGGVRLFVCFPETSAPGVLFAGTTPDLSVSGYQGLSTDSLTGLPGSHLGIGNRGACATIRPYDNGSFEFFSLPVSGYAAATIPYMTAAYIAGINFPATSLVWYEAILNFEGISKTATSSSVVPSDDQAPPSLADYFPTPGNLWTAIRSQLTPAVIMDGLGAGAQLMRGNRAGAALYAGKAASRLILGSGQNFNTNFVQRASRENSLIVEEMKEDADGTVILNRLDRLDRRRRAL